jgi:hypothetical protein
MNIAALAFMVYCVYCVIGVDRREPRRTDSFPHAYSAAQAFDYELSKTLPVQAKPQTPEASLYPEIETPNSQPTL